jgi:DNA-cytosine methyltransferase
MKILSLFSGIGGFDKAFEDIFGKDHEVWFSEIDKYAIQVYKNHFPNATELGDITKIDIKSLPQMDFIVGGSPCQDLSIAKKDRQGLDGSRSGLFWKFVEIIKTNKPKYFVLENVNSMPKEAKQIITEALGRYLYPESEWDIVD